MSPDYDVIIIGGGPAGATCATMLARDGFDVLVLERRRFPRFHIGESITAFGFEAFHRLGVYDELNEINYVQKRGLEFVYHDTTAKVRFLRDDKTGLEPWAFQMARDKMDEVLLRNAREAGAEVREEVLVKEVLFDGDEAQGVAIKQVGEGASDEITEIHAKWVVDASGQSAVINRQLKDNWYADPLLDKKMAVFSHWKGDIEIENGDHELNFKLCVHKNRRDWAWYIPIAKDTLSLGVVLSPDTVKAEGPGRTPEQIFYDYAKDIPVVGELIQDPRLSTVEPFRVIRDYSYRSVRYYGKRWTIVGDSAGFIDPVFSTGLQVAFNSAFALIEPLKTLLRQEKPDLSLLEEYNAALDRYYRVNSMLVYLFYLSELDHDNYHSASFLWNNIEWAGIKDRLAFLWHGLRFVRAKPAKRLAWGTQVLFGNPSKDNVVADLYMALSRNYDKVLSAKQGAPPPRLAAPA